MFVYEYDNGILIASMDMPGRSANVLNEAFGEGFREFLEKIEAEKSQLKGVILTSAKKTFLAGADLEFLRDSDNAQQLFDSGQMLKEGMRRMEKWGKPIVAALNGAALGGGFELALACHHRIAPDDASIKIGLPEVKLGLIPGGGGITRLIRLLGLQAALPFLIEGRELSPAEALKNGFIHQLASDRSDMLAKAKAWIEANPQAQQPWDQKGYKLPGGAVLTPQVGQMLAIAPAMAAVKTYHNYPAVQAIMSAGVEGALLDFDTALRIEIRYFVKTALSPEARNMTEVFWFQLNEIKAGGSRPKGFPVQKVQRIGVLGAGMMGAAIAFVCAKAGIQVVLKDVSLEKAEKGKDYSRNLLNKSLAKRRISAEQAEKTLGLIQATGLAEDLTGCEVVIEAVFENRELKAGVTREAEAKLGPAAIFASNTSTLPITGLAAASARPAQFIGLHFFSPADKMPLVEIIVGKETSDETLARAFDLVLQLNKTPIVVNDSRGFYTSRVFSTYVMEGAAMLAEGYHPRLIEMAGLMAGMPVGPLALMDEVSLKLIHDIRNQTARDLAAAGITLPEHPATPVLEKMVNACQRFGKAYGGGFYDYPQNGKKQLWPGLLQAFPANILQTDIKMLQHRMLFIQSIETVRCMEEGVLRNVPDANIGSVFGWGFAPFHGGTLQYINEWGLPAFAARCQELAAQFGPRFSPPALLLQKAAAGSRF